VITDPNKQENVAPEQGATVMRKTIHFEGREYFDDRLFVLELTPVAARSLTEIEAPKERWAVITRRNTPGYPPFRSDDFESREAAIRFLHDIALTTPLISKGGRPPMPAITLSEFKAWLAFNGLEALPE
jgi:hypothetical protein